MAGRGAGREPYEPPPVPGGGFPGENAYVLRTTTGLIDR
jgi:hypothetical protein